MKLVEGRPWSAMLESDWATLPPDEYLSRHLPILMAMTQAVAFAHSRGIIHRDLKPAQVMVGGYGEVLLTDWGLAIKASEEDAPAKPHSAAAGGTTSHWRIPSPGTASNPAGTPALMAPEQTRANASAIGPWTDVYLLGGTLYRLLTGTYPHEANTAVIAMDRAAKGDVELPSVRAPHRAVPPDLEALCLKALRPKPQDRLESAQAFWQALDEHVRGSARRAKSRESATAAKAALDAAPATYDAFTRILAQIDEARRLWPDNPECDALHTRALQGSARLAIAQGDLTLARLHATAIADAALAHPLIAAIDRAEADARRRHRQFRIATASAFALLVLVACGSVAFVLSIRAKNAELERRTLEATEARNRAEANLAIARTQGAGANKLIEFILRDLRIALAEDLVPEKGVAPEAAQKLSYSIAGKVATPIQGYFSGLQTDAWPRDVLRDHVGYLLGTAFALEELGRSEESLVLSRQAYNLTQQRLDGDKDMHGLSLQMYAQSLTGVGNYKDAGPMLLGELQRNAQAPPTTNTLNMLRTYSYILVETQQYAEATPWLEKAMAASEQLNGPDSPITVALLNSLGTSQYRAGQFEQGIATLERALQRLESLGEGDTARTGRAYSALAEMLTGIEDTSAKTRRYHERGIEITRRHLGPEHPEVGTALTRLSSHLLLTKEFEDAHKAIDQAVAIYTKSLGTSHPWTMIARGYRADVFQAERRFREAADELELALIALGTQSGPNVSTQTTYLITLINLNQRHCLEKDLRSLIEAALPAAREYLGNEDKTTLRLESDLGLAAAQAGDFETATRLATEAHSRAQTAKALRDGRWPDAIRTNLFRVHALAAIHAPPASPESTHHATHALAAIELIAGKPAPRCRDEALRLRCHQILGQTEAMQAAIKNLSGTYEYTCLPVEEERWLATFLATQEEQR